MLNDFKLDNTMNFSIIGFGIFIIGIVNLLFNREMSERGAEYQSMFSKAPREKLIKHYRIGGYVGGTIFVIVGFLHMFMII
jgi:hypothetical protein